METVEQVVEKGKELAAALDAAQRLPLDDRRPALLLRRLLVDQRGR